jgi:hypothetical protein
MTDWQIPAALRNFGPVSQGVYSATGSKARLVFFGRMAASAGCGHWGGAADEVARGGSYLNLRRHVPRSAAAETTIVETR